MKKTHRFIFDTDLDERLVIRDGDLLHQWSKVLKFTVDEEIVLCDGRGHEAVYRMTDIGKKTAELERVGNIRRNEAEPEVHVSLYAAILKKEHFEWVVQKTTECGVAEIVPVITDRTVKKNVKLSRLEEIAKEAAEQSGRGRVPTLHEPLSLKAALAHAQMNAANYFFHIDEREELFQGVKSTDDRIGLFIGPEGGWTDEEAERGEEAGCQLVSLGQRVLRGETACIVSVYLAAQI